MPTDGPALPHPKAASTKPGRPRRYRRKVASDKDWQRIVAAKQGPCRVCVSASTNGLDLGVIEFHHVVPRAAPWFGDDLEDNIVPVHQVCHTSVTIRHRASCEQLLRALSDAEYAYAIQRGGEGFFERAYGIVYERPGAAGPLPEAEQET